MNRKTSLLLIFFCCFSVYLHAQYNIKENNVWVFGYHASLDFNSGSPVLNATNIENANGFASVSDTAGNLLFYTQGREVWDRTGVKMPNGIDIFPVVGRLSPYSAVQGSLIVPVIGSADRYYLFTQEATSNSPYVFGTDTAVSRLFYSIIDMSLNGGLGDVDPAYKGIQIDSGLGGPLLAIRGDACNIWVLVHDIDQNIFKAYDINPSGINLQPVVSVAGNLTTQYSYNLCHMKASGDRRKIALGSQGRGSSGVGLELYDFDPATGIVSNAVTIDDQVGPGGIAFSPDNSKLYAAALVLPYYYRLLQYNVGLPTGADIRSSMVVIDSTAQWRDLKLAPNGKIYHAADNKIISCINSPNLAGLACDYTEDVIPFSSAGGTPAVGAGYFSNEFVRAAPLHDTVFVKSLDTLVCPNSGGQIHLSAPAGYLNYSWSNGSSDSVLDVSQPGTYWVTSSDFCGLRVDTFVISHTSVVPVMISVNGYVLSTTHQYASYQWYRSTQLLVGETNPTYTVIVNGDYSVKVTDSNGCTDSSDAYQVRNVSVEGLQQAGDAVHIYPNPARDIIYISAPDPVNIAIRSLDGKTVFSRSWAKEMDISALSAGVYMISVTDEGGRLLRVEKLVKTVQ